MKRERYNPAEHQDPSILSPIDVTKCMQMDGLLVLIPKKVEVLDVSALVPSGPDGRPDKTRPYFINPDDDREGLLGVALKEAFPKGLNIEDIEVDTPQRFFIVDHYKVLAMPSANTPQGFALYRRPIVRIGGLDNQKINRYFDHWETLMNSLITNFEQFSAVGARIADVRVFTKKDYKGVVGKIVLTVPGVSPTKEETTDEEDQLMFALDRISPPCRALHEKSAHEVMSELGGYTQYKDLMKAVENAQKLRY
jgi:hypothetical protein